MLVAAWIVAAICGWQAKIEKGRVTGYVDHPKVIELVEDTIDLKDMGSIDAGRDNGEYIVKLKAPVHHETVKELEKIVSAEGGWVNHVSRNTYIAHVRKITAKEIQTNLRRVSFVATVPQRFVKSFKQHHSVSDTGPGYDRSQLVVSLHAEGRHKHHVEEAISRHDPFVKVTMEENRLYLKHHNTTTNWSGVVSALLHEDIHESAVAYIEHPITYKPLNKYSRPVLSTGTATASEPYAHLDGEGAVVGVADTGIDADHCFFNDPSRSVPYDRLDPAHRKIVTYKTADNSIEGMSDKDTGGGHGTHVVGTVAGEMFNPSKDPAMAEYHGFVPKAKIAFIDLAGKYGSTEAVSVPSNIEKELFKFAHDAGAHVHSNSWGGGRSTYSLHAQHVDSFSRSYPTDLVLFSAGNEADKACEKTPSNPKCDKYTILSPSVAKNCVSVGASMAPLASWQEMGLDNFLLDFNGFSYLVTKGYFGDKHPTLPTNVLPVMVDPENGCSSSGKPGEGHLSNAAAIRGKLAIVNRGVCFFGVKVQELQDAGAVGVVIVNHVPGDPIVMGLEDGQKSEFKIPAYMISLSGGNQLKADMKKNPTITTSIVIDQKPSPHKNMNNVAEFSSRGPTSDLRFKPDVVAVGYYVHSARSDSMLDTQNCDLEAEMGTSMACPMVAAVAVQIRQWLQKGGHGTSNPEPSGVLVKAMLVQSAVPLTGLVDRNAQGDWEQLDTTPSFYQGHGRVTLDAVMSTQHKTVPLFINEGEVGTGDELSFCVNYATVSKYGFRATLVWMDASAGSNSKWALVNDLDLRVMTPDGHVHLGNGIGSPADHERDALNNVEKVSIKDAQPGVYKIVVKGFSMGSSSTQKFALVASGIEGTGCDALPACVGSSFCEVSEFTGEKVEKNLSLLVWGEKLYKYKSPGGTKALKIVVERQTQYDKYSDVDIFIRKGAPPSMKEYDTHYDMSQRCTDCAAEDVKMLQETVNDDKAGDEYFIGLHAGCCHAAVLDLTITEVTEVDPNKPVIHSVSVRNSGSDGTSDVVVSDDLTRTGTMLSIKGANLGSPKDVAVGYEKKLNGVDLRLKCTVAVEESSDKEIICMTQSMSYNVISKLEIYTPFSPNPMLTKQVVRFATAQMSNHRVQGLFSSYCDSTEQNCLPFSSVYFNRYLTVYGSGDVYIEGRSIGERWYGQDEPMATVNYGHYECTVQEYVSDDMLHCRTSPHVRAGIYKLNITFDGVPIAETSTTLQFEDVTVITGISNSVPPVAKSSVELTYAEAFDSTLPSVTLFGRNLYDQQPPVCVGNLVICGMSEVVNVPSPGLKVTVGRYPEVEDGECEVFDYENDRIRCELNVTIIDEMLYFKVRRFGFSQKTTDTMATLRIMGEAATTGLSYKGYNEDPAPRVDLPFSVVSENGERRVFIHGQNLGVEGQRMAVFVFKTMPNQEKERIGSCPNQLLNDKLIEFQLPSLESLKPEEGAVYEVILHVGSTTVDQVPLSFTIMPLPTLDGVSLTKTGTPSRMLMVGIDATYLYLFGKHGKDPVVLYGNDELGYACNVVEADSAVIKCELTPESTGIHMMWVYYGGVVLDPEVGIAFERNTTSFSSAVEYNTDVLLATVPFSIRMPNNPLAPMALTTAPRCGYVGKDMDDAMITIFKEQGGLVTIGDGSYLVCFQHLGFWYEAEPGLLPLAVVDRIHLVSIDTGSQYWGQAYPRPIISDGGSSLGAFPAETHAKLKVEGLQLPKTAVIRVSEQPCKGGIVVEKEPGGTEWMHIFLLANPRVSLPESKKDAFYLCFQTSSEENAAHIELGHMSVAACFSSEQCSNKGQCVDGSCQCEGNARGVHCDTVCPMGVVTAPNGTKIPTVCSGAGFCGSYGGCTCYAEHFGADCSLAAKELPLGKKLDRLLTHLEGDLLVHSWDQQEDIDLYLTVEWEDPSSMFDVLIWDSPDQVGQPDKVKQSHVMKQPYTKTKQIIVEIKMQSEYLFVGVYGASPKSVDVGFGILLSTSMEAPVESTPAPLMDTAQKYAEEYTAVAIIAGVCLGILLVCLLGIIWRIFLRPIYRLFKSKQPRVLDETFDDIPMPEIHDSAGEGDRQSQGETEQADEFERNNIPIHPPPPPSQDGGEHKD
eukprot:TRINITY_DN2938_c0_g3_i1.p1 TRINITY_DN2938_c0_g3~~TRINITY_DN2938_c0_g3_i1.p1  ORF type:complete len:2104 (+),score=505.41 TRINITY_DN2938_c0_g3_i1:70-6381(+)